MPDINVTAQLLHEMAMNKMKELEARMSEVQTELAHLQGEHGKLYAMVLGAERHSVDAVAKREEF